MRLTASTHNIKAIQLSLSLCRYRLITRYDSLYLRSYFSPDGNNKEANPEEMLQKEMQMGQALGDPQGSYDIDVGATR